jgi:ferric-dicitrate binding protein FerR (iron transport regulator)
MTEHDPIEALLKASGRRPGVAADRADRVREVVSAAWREEVARRGRVSDASFRVALAVAAVVVVAVGLAAFALRPYWTDQTPVARVDRVAGAAWVRGGSLFASNTPLTVGAEIATRSTVSTGPDGRVAFRLSKGHSVRLDVDTALRVSADRELSLLRGAVYLDSRRDPAAVPESLRIATPFGTIENQGTQFAVRLDGSSLSVKVREGTVTIATEVERLVARAGEGLRLDRSGRAERTEEAPDGGSWAWAEAVAPMMDIEGRSLREFLDWVARERGIRLQFADEALSKRAPAVVLTGSVAGMTLDDATTSVLATCGLKGRVEAGALVVER